MADLISRAAAIAQIKENYCDWCDHTDLCQSCETRDCIATIEQHVPTIDAIPVEKYKAEIETLRSRCYPGAEDAFGRKAYGCLKIVPVSYGTKSVDAIPVEWLRDMMLESEAEESRAAWVVMREWRRWKQEQEAKT